MSRSHFMVVTTLMLLILGGQARNSVAQERLLISAMYCTAVPYEIESKDSDGALTIRILLPKKVLKDVARRRLSPSRAIAMVSRLTEGYFLGFAGLPESSDQLLGFFEEIRRGSAGVDGLKVLRVEVKEVSENGRALIQVGPNAAARLAVGDYLSVVRPAGSTTAQLLAVPDFLPITDGRGKYAGMDWRTATILNESINNVKQIGLALHNFHATHGCLPPAVIFGPDGKPWHSWRVLLLPYLDQTALYDQYRFDEPWNGPNNIKLLEHIPPLYKDPVYGKSDENYTHYAMAVGKQTAFPPEGYRMVDSRQFMGRGMGKQFHDFHDGISNTILLGSVSPKREIPWTKPEDVVIDDNFDGIGMNKSFAAPYAARENTGGVFLRADGSVVTIRTDISTQLLIRLLHMADGKIIDRFPTLLPDPREQREQILLLEIPRGATSAKFVLEDLYPQN